MRKKLFILLLLPAILSGCSLFRQDVRLDYLINEKQKIDATQNPAKKLLIIQDLRKKIDVKMDNILVKDIIFSNNIDYDFCIVSDVIVKGKKIECFIYSKQVRKTAHLVKGISRINVTGQFSRFFSVLDDYYTKVDIVEAKISIAKEEASAPAETKK